MPSNVIAKELSNECNSIEKEKTNSQVHSIKLNHVYNFECRATFGTLPQSLINQLFTDGRLASRLLERQLEEWFPEITFVDKKGYDFLDFVKQKYDSKCFTLHGAKFCPSVMIGAGRFVDEEKLWKHATDMIYIFCDIVDFPKVRVVYKKGSDLIQYTKGSIPFKDRDVLFG
jgi:hypothetical protein